MSKDFDLIEFITSQTMPEKFDRGGSVPGFAESEELGQRDIVDEVLAGLAPVKQFDAGGSVVQRFDVGGGPLDTINVSDVLEKRGVQAAKLAQSQANAQAQQVAAEAEMLPVANCFITFRLRDVESKNSQFVVSLVFIS